MALLVAGVVALATRFELVQRHWEVDSYRRDVLAFARYHAQVLAGTADLRFRPSPPHLAPINARRALAMALGISPALTILTIGLLCLLLIASGRRVAWLPLAVAGTFLNEGIVLTTGYETWSPGLGRGASVAVIALAVLPVLWATRRRTLDRRSLPRPVALLAGLAVVVPSVIAYAGPNNSNVPEPLAALAGLAYGVLITASAVPRRWLPGALALPVLALPASGWGLADAVSGGPGSEAGPLAVALGLIAYAAVVWGLGLPWRWLPIAVAIPLFGLPQLRGAMVDGLNGYGPALPSFAGPMALTLAVVVLGAAVPLVGPQLLVLWRKAVRRGPPLSIGPARVSA
ncbi:hypothetical protein acdb102_04140 [Acidothermaceae bacterium B102]|nr:hypothetical protein acdb102_04140 [Acidothermaceae bacterium B102]